MNKINDYKFDKLRKQQDNLKTNKIKLSTQNSNNRISTVKLFEKNKNETIDKKHNV